MVGLIVSWAGLLLKQCESEIVDGLMMFAVLIMESQHSVTRKSKLRISDAKIPALIKE